MWHFPVIVHDDDEEQQQRVSLDDSFVPSSPWGTTNPAEYTPELAEVRGDRESVARQWENHPPMGSINHGDMDDNLDVTGPFCGLPLFPLVPSEPTFEEWYRQRLERMPMPPLSERALLAAHLAYQHHYHSVEYEPEHYHETMEQYEHRAPPALSCGSSTGSGPITMVSGTPSDTVSVHSATNLANPPPIPVNPPLPAAPPAESPRIGLSDEQQYLAALLEAHQAAFESMEQTPAELIGQVKELMQEEVTPLPEDWKYVLVKVSDEDVRCMEREAFEQAWTFAAYILAIRDGHFDPQSAWDTLKRMQLGAAVSDRLCRQFLEQRQNAELGSVPATQILHSDQDGHAHSVWHGHAGYEQGPGY